MPRQTFTLFEFNPETDSLNALDNPDLRAVIATLATRQLPSVVAHHVKKAAESITDHAELFGMAQELVESDKSQKPFLVLRIGDVAEPTDEQNLADRFGSIVGQGVANVVRSNTTIGGSRTPTKPPVETYRKVGSTSRPGHMHTVTLLGGVPVKCTCEGFYFSNERNPGHGTCKHLRLV